MHRITALSLLALSACGSTETILYSTKSLGSTSYMSPPDPRLERVVAEVSLQGESVLVSATAAYQCPIFHEEKVEYTETTTRKLNALRTNIEVFFVVVGGAIIAVSKYQADECQRSIGDLCGQGELIGFTMGGASILAGGIPLLLDVQRSGTHINKTPGVRRRTDAEACGQGPAVGRWVELALPDGSVFRGVTDWAGQAAVALGPQGLAALRSHKGRARLRVGGRPVRAVDLSDDLGRAPAPQPPAPRPPAPPAVSAEPSRPPPQRGPRHGGVVPP